MMEQRLNDLMLHEKLYLDEELTLNILAQEMNISSHQLSELLNNVLNVNFNSFINKFRIEEAKKMISEEPQRSIISVGYAAGFNSKSVFNRAFQQFAGESPSQYKNRLKQ